MGGRGTDPSRSERGEAEPTRPGRAVRWDVRPRQALALGADERFAGRRRSSDRRRFRRQSRQCRVKETICVYLGYLWALRWASAFAMASSLCVFVFAMSRSVFFSVSLCLCGSAAGLAAGFQIHLREQPVERHCRFELGERNLVVDGVRVQLVGRPEADGRDSKETRSGASVG